MLVENARRVRMIGGERDDRLAALAGADIGRRDPSLRSLGRHLQDPMRRGAEHRNADEQRVKHEAERQIDDRSNRDGKDIVAATADRNRRLRPSLRTGQAG